MNEIFEDDYICFNKEKSTPDKYQKLRVAFNAAQELISYIYFPDESDFTNEIISTRERYEKALKDWEDALL